MNARKLKRVYTVIAPDKQALDASSLSYKELVDKHEHMCSMAGRLADLPEISGLWGDWAKVLKAELTIRETNRARVVLSSKLKTASQIPTALSNESVRNIRD